MSDGHVIEVRKIHTTNLLDLAEAVSCGGDERRTGKVESEPLKPTETYEIGQCVGDDAAPPG